MTSRAFPSFRIKLVLTFGLVVLADLAFWAVSGGSVVGVGALAWVLAIMAANPAARRGGQARIAAAVLLGVSLIERPGAPAWILFWTALTICVLSPRAPRFDNAGLWVQRLAFHTILAQFGPLLDGLRTARLWINGRRSRLLPILAALVPPMAGGALFLALFSAANPIIADQIEKLRLPKVDAWRVSFWAFAAVTVWATLRPRPMRRPMRLATDRRVRPGVGAGVLSTSLSLVVFNALFALQNALDIAFLWSGARLPAGVTFAEYAHRGAYALMATALLAGLFVLVALRPGAPTARSRLVRALVTLWIAQNVLLVASCVLRTCDYVEAYSLTRMRIAALIWMGLVAVGLVLICWRLLRGRSGGWLINANAIAVLAVLIPSSQMDFGTIAAAWNARHAREAGGGAVELDLGYMRQLGAKALIPMVELERKQLPTEFADRLAYVRGEVMGDLITRQADWRRWTFRDARRLARAEALLGAAPRIPKAGDRDYAGRLYAPTKPEPLTSATPR